MIYEDPNNYQLELDDYNGILNKFDSFDEQISL